MSEYGMIDSWFDFSGKTVVIPGGAGVLGGEMACALVERGANVVILDRDTALADRLLERMEAGPGCGYVLYGDVLLRDSLIEARAQILEQFGQIDALINAAGGNRGEATTSAERSFFDLPSEASQHVVNLNLMGTFVPCQVFGEPMARRGEGAILNISSMNAYRPLTRIPAYSAAKAAVTNFTQWLAVHMAQEYSARIRVNALAPGFFHTNQNHYLLYNQESGALTARGQAIIDHTPMGRFGLPQDLIGTMLWLLSPAAQFVTGVVVPVDGGFSAFSGV